jgi:(p)ppGpp synthase/HD superfamily hydrolase
LRTWREPPPLTANVTIRPTASFLARKQAETETLVSALTHDAVRLHDDTKLLLPLVDGSRTVRELVESVLALSENTQQSATAEAVENNLAKFAKCGLLIA